MLSEEEKKAIIKLNHYINITAYWKQEEYTNSEIDNYIKTILNLIEKQQKEIEQEKEKNKEVKNYMYDLLNTDIPNVGTDDINNLLSILE